MGLNIGKFLSRALDMRGLGKAVTRATTPVGTGERMNQMREMYSRAATVQGGPYISGGYDVSQFNVEPSGFNEFQPTPTYNQEIPPWDYGIYSQAPMRSQAPASRSRLQAAGTLSPPLPNPFSQLSDSMDLLSLAIPLFL